MFDYPPYNYLFQVAEHCPSAVATYMTLWKDRDKENVVTLHRKDVKTEYLMPFSIFENHLLLLVKEGLASVHEHKKLLRIELTDYSFDCIDKTLC